MTENEQELVALTGKLANAARKVVNNYKGKYQGNKEVGALMIVLEAYDQKLLDVVITEK